MEVTNIEKYPRYVVDVEHNPTEYTVHISVDAMEDSHYIIDCNTYEELDRTDPSYAVILDAAYAAIRAEKDKVSREDLLMVASLANPNVMSTPEMMHKRLTQIDALIREILGTTKTA